MRDEKKAAQKQIEDIKSKLTEEHQMNCDSFKIQAGNDKADILTFENMI